MKWTVKEFPTACGLCGATIPADEPVALLTAKNLVRCMACVDVPVNEQEVENERFRLERERLNVAAHVAPQPEYYVMPTSEPFDPKQAQLGERDE